MAKVMVTGGTGVLGRAVVPRLLADGHDVMVLTRQQTVEVPEGARRMLGDLAGGHGLEAIGGAEVVVHLATQPFRPARVDVGGTGALIEAVRAGLDEPGQRQLLQRGGPGADDPGLRP